MTLLCYSSFNDGSDPDQVKVRNYHHGNPGACNDSSPIIASESTEPSFHWGGNREHYGGSLETTPLTNMLTADDFNKDRLTLCSSGLSNSYAAVAAAAVGSTIWNNLVARGVEIRNLQNARRGLRKWGSTFCWTLSHEVFSKANPTEWLGAMRTIIEAWKSAGVVMWQGGNDLSTTVEGLIPGVCLIADHPTGFPGHLNDIDLFWPPTTNGTVQNDLWANDNLVLFAPDQYNGSQAFRYYPPSSLFVNLRNKARARAALSAQRGRPFVTGIYEHACAELEHFTNGPGATLTSSGVSYPGWNAVYPSTPYSKQFWQAEAGAWLRDNWPDLAFLVYWDNNANGNSGPGSVGITNFLDSSEAAWDSFIANWVNNSTFQNASDPVPSGAAPPSPPVNSPQLVSSTAIINSTTDGTVFNSTPFDVADDELLLFWLEADRTDNVNPTFPTFSFTAGSGVVPTVPARYFGSENQWSTTAALRSQQSLWLTRSNGGAATGLVLRATFASTHQGCTVIMERIKGADISGVTPSIAAVGLLTAPAINQMYGNMPVASNSRNRTFAFVSHALNEPTTPLRLGPTVNGTPVGAYSSGGSLTLTRPAGAQLGDVLIASMNFTPNPTLVLPDGWTLLARSRDVHVFGIYVDADVLATSSFTWSGGSTGVSGGIVTAYANVGTIGVFAGLSDTDLNASVNMPSVSTVEPDALCIAAIGSYNGVYALSATNSWVQRGVQPSAPQTITILDRPTPTAGAIGTAVATMVTSGQQADTVVVVLESESLVAEGTDVTRLTPGIGTETYHSVTDTIRKPGAQWATVTAAGIVAVEVNAAGSASGVLLGATVNNLSTFETMMGRNVDVERIYVADTAATVPWGSGGWAQAVTANTHGASSFISCFLGTNTWAQIAAGNVDTYLTGIATNLATLLPGVFCYFPEPEDDTGTRGTSAQFRSAMTHVINLMRPLMPEWRFAVCLSDTSWFNTTAFIGNPNFSANGRVPADWIVPEADILAVNAFNRKGATYPAHPYADPAASTYPDIPVALFADEWLATAATYGKTVMLSEFGCAVDDPAVNANGHSTRAQWIAAAMTYMRGKVETVNYTDLDQANQRINLRITGGVAGAEQDSVTAFATGAASVALNKTHTATALIKKTLTKTHTATAIVRKAVTKTHTVTAVINAPLRVTHTADAIITKSGVTKSHTVTAFIQPYVLVVHINSNTGTNVTSVTVS